MKLRKLPAHLLLASVLASSTLAPRLAHAQGAPEQESAAAAQLFGSGDYAKAAAAYEEILKKYPTSLVVSDARFRLGYVYFLLGEHEKSLASLRKIQGPPAADELQELAGSLIPQVLAGQAGLQKDEAKKKSGLEAAIKEYDAFLKKYPNSDQAESANYGRALALFQVGRYEDAAAGLRTNLQKFPKSDSIDDSRYLLALVLATEGARALQADSNSREGIARFDEAERLLNDLITRKADIALANEARFQLGELYFNRALLGPKADQAALWAKALEMYRSVQMREPMLKAQRDRIRAIRERKVAAGRAGNPPEFKRLGRVEDAEVAKLEAIKGKGDLTTPAQVKAGQAYLQQKRYDEARVLLRHMQNLAQEKDQQKAILYYITLSYASQNLVDKAVESYNRFQAAYKGDPIAQNLPLVIGTLFLGTNPPQPQKAIEYFEEGTKLYPKGDFAAATLAQQATALLQMRKYDEALQTYRNFLSGKPSRELAAQAEAGIASIYQQTGKIDDALAAHRKVRDTYKGTPQAEQSAFWVGHLLLAKKDNAGALKELTAFLKDYPQSELASTALFDVAQAESARNDKAKAMEIFKEVAEKYPKSQAAPYTYFERGRILMGDQKVDEINALLREYIARYPQDPNLYRAYEWIAQNETAASKPLEAIAAFTEMAEKHPQDPKAADALLNAAKLWNQYARSQGRYLALNEEQRVEWNKGVNGAIAAGEKLIAGYPASPAVAQVLQELLDCQKLLQGAKLKSPADVSKYFEELAARNQANPAARSKILFTLASYTYESDKAKAMEQMKAAYDPSLVYAAGDIDLYGTALIASGKLDEAAQLFQKLAADYPNPAGAAPAKAPLPVQEAQAISLFGLGKVLQQQHKVAEAAKLFDQLKQLYPWSPKVLEADYGIAEADFQQKRFDQAVPALIRISRAQTATIELRAKAMLLLAQIQEAKNEVPNAIDTFLKIAGFYESVAPVAAEGLWRGGQLLEKQAATLGDTVDPKKPKAPTRSGQLKRALKAYRDLVQKYPDSPHADAAKARAQALQPQGK